jgi:hypothetical protein
MMAGTPRSGNWSMKQGRELIKLSKLSLTLEAVAERLGRKPATILKTASRLGLTLKRRDSTRLKPKGK